MSRLFRYALLAIAVGIAGSPLTSTPARGDRYWRNHWRWYDNTYRPYYQRRYYSGPTYYQPRSYYYGPRYADPYYDGGRYYDRGYYDGGYYDRGYYDRGYSGGGYYRPYYGGSQVQVGPLQFGWW